MSTAPGAEEPLRIELEAVLAHGRLLDIVSFAHVGLPEIAGEGDTGVTVRDHVLDGLGHARGVVRHHRRGFQPVDLLVREHEALPAARISSR